MLLSCLLALAGCGDDDDDGSTGAGSTGGSTTAGTTGASSSSTTAGGGSGSSGDETGAMLTCAEQALLTGSFDVDEAGPDTQIHANAVFDGEGIWLVYNLPEPSGSGLFDVHGVRLGCDGTALWGPEVLNTTTAGNDIDPHVALSGGRALVTWVTDDGLGGTANLQIYYRVFELDGAAVMDTDARLATAAGGQPVPDNHLGAAVTAETDGFVVVGVRALVDTGTFHAFAQRIDLDGAMLGEALEPPRENGISHALPAAVVDGNGDLLVSYNREEGDDSEVMRWSPGGGPPTPMVGGLTLSSGSDLAIAGHDPNLVYVAISGATAGDRDIHVFPLGAAAVSDALSIGGSGRLDHTPRLAPHPRGGGAIAYHRNISGFSNEVVVQRFAASGDLAAAAEVVVATDPPAPPYAPAVTHVADDIWLIAWSDGMSPDFRLRARFVELPAR